MRTTHDVRLFILSGLALALVSCSATDDAASLDAPDEPATPSPYLYVWAGDPDAAEGDSDFLAVVDANPESPTYGSVLGTAPVGSAGNDPHHAEPTSPVDMARLTLDEGFIPHWAQVDPGTYRAVVTGIGPGLSMTRDEWPHGPTGPAMPHAALFGC